MNKEWLAGRRAEAEDLLKWGDESAIELTPGAMLWLLNQVESARAMHAFIGGYEIDPTHPNRCQVCGLSHQEHDELKKENAALKAQFKSVGIVPYLDRMKELAERAEKAETLLHEAASIVDDVMAYADCHTSPELLNAAERFSTKLRARKEG